MINEVSVSYRSRTFCYVEYCIRITVTTFIFTFFERITAYDRNSFIYFFFHLLQLMNKQQLSLNLPLGFFMSL